MTSEDEAIWERLKFTTRTNRVDAALAAQSMHWNDAIAAQQSAVRDEAICYVIEHCRLRQRRHLFDVRLGKDEILKP